MSHEKIETNVGWMAILIAIAISFGGLAEIVPLMYGRYSDDWHRVHLINPRDVVPVSNMPGYPFLAENAVDPGVVTRNMRALKRLGDPYTDEDIAGAAAAVSGKSEMDALIAYLQGLGKHAPVN